MTVKNYFSHTYSKNRMSLGVWLGKFDIVLPNVWYWATLPYSENVLLVSVWSGQDYPSGTSFDDRAVMAPLVR